MNVPFLNIDAGELESEPPELYLLAHVVEIACGGHAGDDTSMARVLDACAAHGTGVGAHPSFPDRIGFGRTAITISAEALLASVAEQCHSLASIARRRGATVRFAKLHGALYHSANGDRATADSALRGMVEALGYEITLLGPRKGALAERAAELGIRFAVEGFADRGMLADGSLVPRGSVGALIEDPALAATQARTIAPSVDTICVHGDTPNAVAIAREVRSCLDAMARAKDAR
ncbi:5-oxoprolinase subunit PxpA [soil metagenome]